MSVYPSNKLITDTLNLIKGDTPYLALYSTNPTAADSGTEISGGSYARMAITFGAISGGAIKNTSAITYTGLPAGAITHWGIKNAVSAGDLLAYGTLSTSVTVTSGDQLQFQSSTIEVNLSGS